MGWVNLKPYCQYCKNVLPAVAHEAACAALVVQNLLRAHAEPADNRTAQPNATSTRVTTGQPHPTLHPTLKAWELNNRTTHVTTGYSRHVLDNRNITSSCAAWRLGVELSCSPIAAATDPPTRLPTQRCWDIQPRVRLGPQLHQNPEDLACGVKYYCSGT